MTTRRLRFTLIGISIALAALHAYASRYRMNPDGIVYLDLGAAIMRGDWPRALSSYWGPVYPFLLGLLVSVTRSQGLGQFAVAHFLDFLLFVVDLFLFDRFWRLMLAELPERTELRALKQFGLYIGYAAFVYVFVPMLELITPDLLLSSVVLTVGLLLWKFAFDGQSRWLVSVGFLLGFGYLIKAVMFPVGLVTMFAAAATLILQRRSVRPVIFATLALLSIASPLIVLLSHRAGHLTTGDTGRLAYAWYVSNDPRANGELLYPIGPQVSRNPDIYKVETKPHITFWPAFDPPALSKGVQAKPNFQRQLLVLKENLRSYRDHLLVGNPFLVMTILILFAFNIPALRKLWSPGFLPLAVFIFSALAAYALILVEPRYINAFGCLLMGSLLGLALRNLKQGDAPFAAHVLMAAAILITVQVSPSLLFFVLEPFRTPDAQSSRIDADGNREEGALSQARVTQALLKDGLIAGDGVAIIGSPYTNYWPKLAQASISAYIPSRDMEKFCNSGEGPDERTLQLTRATGARWIVTSSPLSGCPPGWWTGISGTDYVFRKLP